MDTNEVHNNITMSSGGGSNTSLQGSRWNPTREQINMLENLYKQGIRTPTADQIQQITARLRAFGHIEGKNVFYWFQNHKARQRQKQKQERLAFYNRFHKPPLPFPHHQPLYPPNCTNGFTLSPFYFTFTFACNKYIYIYICYLNLLFCTVVCGPYIGFYQQNPKVVLPSCSKPSTYGYDQVQQDYGNQNGVMNQETLDLFPLHPTGVLQGRRSYSAEDSTETEKDCVSDQPFFDFFSK